MIPHQLIFIQNKAKIDSSLVNEYAKQMATSIKLKPAQTLQDQATGLIYVWQGIHRGDAATITRLGFNQCLIQSD